MAVFQINLLFCRNVIVALRLYDALNFDVYPKINFCDAQSIRKKVQLTLIICKLPSFLRIVLPLCLLDRHSLCHIVHK